MATNNPYSANDNVFEVERILKKRTHPSRGPLYYVKWRNFPTSDNTWEPSCNFSQKLIDDFESKQRRQVTNKRTSTSVRRSVGTLETTTTTTTTTTTATATATASTAQTISDHSLSPCSSLTISCSSLSTISSTVSSSIPEPSVKRMRGSNSSKKTTNLSRRQQQFQLQMHIHQRQIGAELPVDKQQLAIFNPVAGHCLPAIEGKPIMSEAKLTKEPIIVTDVTNQDLTVTISECKTPEGFFSI